MFVKFCSWEYKFQEQSKKNSRKIKELLILISRNQENICEYMTNERPGPFDKHHCVNEMYGLMELKIFIYAFQLGNKSMLEHY